jgi:hypothetical protein
MPAVAHEHLLGVAAPGTNSGIALRRPILVAVGQPDRWLRADRRRGA